MPKSFKALSLSERQNLIRNAIQELTEDGRDYSSYGVEEVYDDYAVACSWEDMSYWRVAYTLDETTQTVTVQPFAEWQRVEKDWNVLPNAAGDEQKALIAFGGPLKALGEGKVGGLAVVFSSDKDPDLTGDFFNKSTDFDIEDGERGTVLYNHGYDPELKGRKLGGGPVEIRDAGVWIEAQLNLRDEYEKAVYGLVEAGKMGWSTGVPGHLVSREPVGKAMHIKNWPLGKDFSITPTPAEPRTAVVPLKALRTPSLKSLLDGQRQDAPEATPEAPAGAADAAKARTATDIQVTQGEGQMADNQTPPADELKALGGRVDALTDNLNKFMKFMEDSPAIKNAGYFTQDGGKADPSVKSFGDWLKAVARHDESRLKAVYGSVKAINENSGAAGGYLVPEQYMTELLRVTLQNSSILQKVRRNPVSSNGGKWPALDNFVTPTAGVGQTAAAGGVTTAKRAQGGAYTNTDPAFTEIEWRLNDAISGTTKASKELIADSPQAIESLLKDLIGIADAAKQEYYILRGSGAGEPLGILNAPCLATKTAATTNTVKWVDVLAMFSVFKQVAGAPGWWMHPSVWPDIGVMEVGTGGGAVLQANMGAGVTNNLLGYVIETSQHLPQADNDYSIVLADFGAYVLFEKGGLEIDYSEHADFSNGNGVWRFSHRMDGMPWMKNAITLGDPQGSFKVSPFVGLKNA